MQVLMYSKKKSSPVIIPVDLAYNRHAFSMQSTKWSESFWQCEKESHQSKSIVQQRTVEPSKPLFSVRSIGWNERLR
jgi:hypothetical protein